MNATISRSVCACVLAACGTLVATVGSADAAIFTYTANLSGPAESPPNASPGTGFTTVTYNNVARTLRVEATFSGLLGVTSASHIHSNSTIVPGVGTAGVATQTPSFVGFPLGVSAGVFDNTYDLTLASSWNAAYITGNGGSPGSAETALALQLSEGRAYLNIHTNLFPGGEIRGFLVPGPGTAGLIAMAGLAGFRRRRR